MVLIRPEAKFMHCLLYEMDTQSRRCTVRTFWSRSAPHLPHPRSFLGLVGSKDKRSGVELHSGMNSMGMDRVGGPGGSALAIQISQAGWKDVVHLSEGRHRCLRCAFRSTSLACAVALLATT